MTMQLVHESGETYLETILILREKQDIVRSIDIANELGYTKPSVSRAVKLLKERGYIVVQKGGAIELTKKGLDMANKVYERHLTITKFFIETLGVDPDTAEKDACRIEHIISQETFEKIKERVEKQL
ncbi:metal-dependent transcriptional regulator [Synergistaceae bacterium OttesenSCG-928-D05]|nr:metal-dependent transcriptional regulator [Synergistaceae bacterium OttesenSCG-928-D05]